jgi:hypothetical protein
LHIDEAARAKSGTARIGVVKGSEMGHPGFTSLQEAMRRTLNQLGLGVSLSTAAIHRVWSEVVGEEVARRSQPGLLKNGRLQVTVSDAVWLQQLTMLKPTILASLESHLGSRVVRELFFTVGTLSFPPVRRESTFRDHKSAAISPEVRTRLQEVLRPIQDEECRIVLTRILRKAWGAD